MSVEHPKKNEELRKDISSESKLIVIDFFASWCGPCVKIAPVYEQLAKKYTDVRFMKIDVDDEEFNSLAKDYKVRAMPTFKFLKGGQLVGEVVGADKNGLEEKIKEFK